MPEPALTERQARYFAAMQASLERDTGKPLAEWVAIARTCPESGQRAQLRWLKDNYGLLQNHGVHVLSEAFPPEISWRDADKLRTLLWTDAGSTAILKAVERAAAPLPGLITGQRRGYTAWSRNFQFAALKPAKGGAAVLGLAVAPDANARLAPAAKNEGWSERLKSRTPITAPSEVDAEIEALLKAAWERS